MCVPLAASIGGQILAQAPVHFEPPAGSSAKRYSVRPDAVARTVPICGTVLVDTVIVLACELVAPAGAACAANARPVPNPAPSPSPAVTARATRAGVANRARAGAMGAKPRGRLTLGEPEAEAVGTFPPPGTSP